MTAAAGAAREATARLTDDQIALLLDAGRHAPSGGNLQGWLVDAYPDRFELRIDPARSGAIFDAGYFCSFFGLGLFTENVTIVAPSLGFDTLVMFAEDDDPLRARLVIRFVPRAGAEKHPFHDTVWDRHTNRHWSDGAVIPAPIIGELESLVRTARDDFRLHTVSTLDEKKAAARILGSADVLRFLNDSYFEEMCSEFCWTDEEVERRREGIPVRSFDFPGNSVAMLDLLRQHPALRRVLPPDTYREMVKPLMTESSHVCVISQQSRATPESMIEAGRGALRLWHRGWQHGISLHPWTALMYFMLRVEYFGGAALQSREIEAVRDLAGKLRALMGMVSDETPVFVFRLSRPRLPASFRAPRLQVERFATIART